MSELSDSSREEFLRRLGEQLEVAWPEVRQRLGDRYGEFIAHAVAQALNFGWKYAAGLARYANLCVIWGPSFQERDGFEWARQLIDSAQDEWVKVHQLVKRSLIELQIRTAGQIDLDRFIAADTMLLNEHHSAASIGVDVHAEPHLLPRVACDIEAAEFRFTGDFGPAVYLIESGVASLVAGTSIAPLRVGRGFARLGTLHFLTAPPNMGQPSRLQVRLVSHASCDDHDHPAIRFAGSHGRWEWHGSETRTVSWPLTTLAPLGAGFTSGRPIAEETSPEIHIVELLACGLRDEGQVFGSRRSEVWVWPSTQWLLEIFHRSSSARRRTPTTPIVSSDSVVRCRFEADGVSQNSQALSEAFAEGLHTACEMGLHKLLAGWANLKGIEKPVLDGGLGVLVGKAALTWGWTPSALGMEHRPVLRVNGALELRACHAELQLSGELAFAEARARITLKIMGDVPLYRKIDRATDDLPLLETVLPLKAVVNIPLQVELEAMAVESACMLEIAAPVSGALAGEIGIRPRTSGGSGWEWFAKLALQPVSIPVSYIDPFGGETLHTLSILPQMTFLEWSAG